ncbi:MAG: 30S ribosomal protein S16 [Planctomycetes bacterium RBG_16_55_9]|nr:MAG: 30S ribosomal protein S16 [Planctomycetes bacterium RBG_16_55_9]
MAVKLRMTRMGRRHRPFFRINAVESRTPRDGRILEKLGHYDPIEKDPAKQIKLNRERTEYWLEKGAIPSDTVSDILLRAGIKHKYAEQKTARRVKARAAARAKGKLFDNTERIAAKKAAEAIEEKAKVEAEAKAKAEADAKAKQEAQAKAKAEAEAKADAEAIARAEADARAKAEAKAKAAEEKAKAEAAEKEPEPKAEAEPADQAVEGETEKESAPS